MKITDIQNLIDEKNKLQKEIACLISDRDKILNEISEQRNGKNIVIQEKEILNKEIIQMNNILNELNNSLTKQKLDFQDMVNKFFDQKNDLDNQIKLKKLELQEYEKKEIIDIDKINLEYKEQINKNRIELNEIKQEIEELKTKQEQEKQDINNERIEIQIKKLELQDKINELKVKKRQLSLMSNDINKHCRMYNLPFIIKEYGKNK